MVNDIFLVSTAKAAKQAKQAGEFMLARCDSGNLLLTGQFVLSLSEEQFWSVRCKLEVMELGKWYLQTKEGLFKSERDPDLNGWEKRYNEWLNSVEPSNKLTNTLIELRTCNIYTNGFKYVAIKQERIEMLQNSEDLWLSKNMVVIDGVHVIAPMTDNVWKNNTWLLRLPGMDTEQESWEEK
ncbi:hypothetical protein M7775_18190 [Sporomusa sphaeroides DSM 2875]|uniref:hypothetical protein n=1 Tax=Sporomusa sphaeroides TaxID=47679 RepID=UPI00202E95B9|nr:hypothetical protein [Sporomusa sphaeroides]MCM0760487.1 hypothetical protein [Sporomusa sphaeroides DSM 2875]